MSESITINDGSRQRVAFDLMNLIESEEKGVTKDREYYLKLYCQCFQVTSTSVNVNVESILKK